MIENRKKISLGSLGCIISFIFVFFWVLSLKGNVTQGPESGLKAIEALSFLLLIGFVVSLFFLLFAYKSRIYRPQKTVITSGFLIPFPIMLATAALMEMSSATVEAIFNVLIWETLMGFAISLAGAIVFGSGFAEWGSKRNKNAGGRDVH